MKQSDLFFKVAALVLIAFVVRGFWSIQTYSQTYDEAVHIAAGYSYWVTGDFHLNNEHPPFTKLVAAWPVYTFFNPDLDALALAESKLDQWDLGKKLLYESGESADAMLNSARLANLLLGACLIGLIGRWVYRLGGKRPALLAMALAAFDPTLVAHSSLATTDVGVSLFFFAAFYCVWEFSVRSNLHWLVLSGVCLGLALASKFNAVVAIPILFVLIIFRSKRFSTFLHALILLSVAFLVLVATYFGEGIAYWVEGIRFQLEHQGSGHAGYLLGRFSENGWPYYFPIAMAIKIPLGSLFLLACSLFYPNRKLIPAAAILPPLLLLGIGMCATTNIGIRYMLPVFPFLFLIAGLTCQNIGKQQWMVGGLCVATLASSFWCIPHGLSYFNEAIGGPHQGVNYLADSNLDWGQGLRLLKRYVDRNNAEVTSCSYFGTAPPEYYYRSLYESSLQQPNKRKVVVVSTHNALFNNRDLTDMKFIENLGYSLSVFSASQDE